MLYPVSETKSASGASPFIGNPRTRVSIDTVFNDASGVADIVDTCVVDEKGQPLVVYYGVRNDRRSLDRSYDIPPWFHMGRAEQVQAKRCLTAPVFLTIRSPKRMRDKGIWTKEDIEQAKSEGHDGIVYLNRCQGLNFEHLLDAMLVHEETDLATMDDIEFRRIFPEASDSYIAFSPDQFAPVSCVAQEQEEEALIA